MNSPWVIVDGIVVRGHGIASGIAPDNPYPHGALGMQKPFFKARGLDLDGFHEGTLNVSIRPRTFSMKKPEYVFPHVEWTDRHPPEDFSFSRCKLLFTGMEYSAWIYYPDPRTKKAHFQDPGLVEVITSFVPGIHYGDRVKVVLNLQEVEVSDPRRDEEVSST